MIRHDLQSAKGALSFPTRSHASDREEQTMADRNVESDELGVPQIDETLEILLLHRTAWRRVLKSCRSRHCSTAKP